MELEQRLNQIIAEKECEIEALSQRIGTLKKKQALQQLLWQAHENFQETEIQKKLPVPRLEMRFSRAGLMEWESNWYNVRWHYGIVYKHFVDTETDTMTFIPLGQTTSKGGDGTFASHFQDGRLELPFRDRVHILAESKLFSLPAYILCEEMSICQKIEVEIDLTDALSKMKRNGF